MYIAYSPCIHMMVYGMKSHSDGVDISQVHSFFMTDIQHVLKSSFFIRELPAMSYKLYELQATSPVEVATFVRRYKKWSMRLSTEEKEISTSGYMDL